MAQKKRAPDAGKHAIVLCAAERQSSTTVPFGTTVMPSGVTVKPRAKSCSVSMPTVEFSVNTTFLSRIAL